MEKVKTRVVRTPRLVMGRRKINSTKFTESCNRMAE